LVTTPTLQLVFLGTVNEPARRRLRAFACSLGARLAYFEDPREAQYAAANPAHKTVVLIREASGPSNHSVRHLAKTAPTLLLREGDQSRSVKNSEMDPAWWVEGVLWMKKNADYQFDAIGRTFVRSLFFGDAQLSLSKLLRWGGLSHALLTSKTQPLGKTLEQTSAALIHQPPAREFFSSAASSLATAERRGELDIVSVDVGFDGVCSGFIATCALRSADARSVRKVVNHLLAEAKGGLFLAGFGVDHWQIGHWNPNEATTIYPPSIYLGGLHHMNPKALAPPVIADDDSILKSG